jgi:hypothetical protein
MATIVSYMKRTTTVDYDLRQKGITPPREIEPQHSQEEWDSQVGAYLRDHREPAFVEEGPVPTALELRIKHEEEPE